MTILTLPSTFHATSRPVLLMTDSPKWKNTSSPSPVHKISVMPTSGNSFSIALCFSLATASYGTGIHTGDKIVVPKEKRYKMVKEVHDILGHKKICATRCSS
jgi:hypothetical protein